MSFGMMVTRFAWMAQRLVSSKRVTRYDSAASCFVASNTGPEISSAHSLYNSAAKNKQGTMHAQHSSPNLEGKDRGGLEPEVVFEVPGDLSHQARERQFADQQIRAFLILSDLAEGHSSRSGMSSVLCVFLNI